MRQFLLLSFALLLTENVFGHARLLVDKTERKPPADLLTPFESPKPRDTQDGYKIFAGNQPPCGNNTASATLANFTKGQAIKFEWIETIQHDGYYIFQISTDNGANWTTIGQYNDDQNVLQGPAPHYYPSVAQANFKVQLPANLTCERCTIRFIQHMNNQVVNHANTLDNVDYFSCADVKISEAVVTPPPAEPPPVTQEPPPPAGNSSQSSQTLQNNGPQFSSCGLIKNNRSGLPPNNAALVATVLLMPLLLLQTLRPQRARRRSRFFNW